MKILLWQAAILPGQQAEFEAYANTRVLQFFKQQRGCLGVSFFQHGHQLQFVSYWHNNKAAQQMLDSAAYQQLQALLRRQYFVAANPIEYGEIQGGFFTEQALSQLASTHAYATQQELSSC